MINRVTNWGVRKFASGLRRAGVPAGVRKVSNVFGERDALVVGKKGRVINKTFKELLGLPKQFNIPSPQNPNHLGGIGKLLPFGTITVREVLRGMQDLIEKEWRYDVVAIYFYRFGEDSKGNLTYAEAINTSHTRGAIFNEEYRGKQLVKIDQLFSTGKLKETVVAWRFDPRNLRYGVDKFIRNMSLLFGAKYYIIVPVFDGDRVVGKINIGLRRYKRGTLSTERRKALEEMAGRLIGTTEDRETYKLPLNLEYIRTFNENVKRTSFLKLLLWSILGGPAENMMEIIEILDETIEASLEVYRDREATNEKLYSEILFTLADAIEARERYTGGHCFRVARVSQLIGENMPPEEWVLEIKRNHGNTCKDNDAEIAHKRKVLYLAALIHDIGKISLRDDILLKEGPLTDSEYAEMKLHAEKGGKLVEKAQRRYPKNYLLATAMEIAVGHHKDYDGRGYPASDRRIGKELPLAARIVRVADSYHTMISSRGYKEAYPVRRVIKELVEGIGTLYDPAIVRTFLGLLSGKNQSDESEKIAEVDILMEEIRSEIRALAEREDDVSIYNGIMLENLADKLKSLNVNEIKKSFEDIKRRELASPSLDELFADAISRTKKKTEELIRFSQLSLEFYDAVIIRILDVISDYAKLDGYNPKMVRTFIGSLFEIWESDKSMHFIDLIKGALGRMGKEADDFGVYFFRDLIK